MGCPAPQAPSLATWVGVQRAVARHGGPGGSGCRPCRRHPVRVLGQRPVSSVRCERPVSTRACLRPASSVRCGVRAFRCPMSGVRCPCVPHPLTEVRSWSAAVGQAAARLGWPGSAWLPAVSMTGSSSARVAWGSKLAQAVLDQRKVGLDLVVVGGGLAVGQVDCVADRDRLDAREDRPSVGSWVATTLRGHCEA